MTLAAAAAAAAPFSLQCAKLPMASLWEFNLHSPEFLLSAFQIKGQLLSCFAVSLNVAILSSFMNRTIRHLDQKLALMKRRRHHTVAKNTNTLL